MAYNPNQTDSWSVRDIQDAERRESQRRTREVLWACLGILAMLLAVIVFLIVVTP